MKKLSLRDRINVTMDNLPSEKMADIDVFYDALVELSREKHFSATGVSIYDVAESLDELVNADVFAKYVDKLLDEGVIYEVARDKYLPTMA